MNAQSAAAALCENREIAAGLRGFYDAKSVFLARDRQVLCIIACNLKENPRVGTPLVGLSCGVQKARSETQNGGDFFFVAHRVPNSLERFLIFAVQRKRPENCEVIAAASAREMLA